MRKPSTLTSSSLESKQLSQRNEGSDKQVEERSKIMLLREKGGKKEKSNQNISDFGVALESKQSEDSFEKYYSKELDLEEDEVPIVLHELSDSALNYIAREQYDKALMLLQKSQSILEQSTYQQLNYEKTRSDRYIILVILHNMAMCYQKMGALEECALCIEGCLININSTFLIQNNNYFSPLQIAEQKMKKLKYECRAHMQVCALLSQLHKHKEALSHALIAVRMSHYLIKDLINLCLYCIEKVYIAEDNNQEEGRILDSLQFQDQQSTKMPNQEVSLLERTAIRVLPILKELERRMLPEQLASHPPSHNISQELDDHSPCGPNPSSSQLRNSQSSLKNSSQHLETDTGIFGEVDMRSLLGYLNQNEWIWSLNIGNIMQLAPLTLQDICNTSCFELELTRELILEKITFIAISYFCVSTELRFLVNVTEDGDLRPPLEKRKDSEYWHSKALEIGTSFLPSECPLVNHILMSYNKHHAPSNQVISEESPHCDEMKVLKALKGIESNKYQPIVRALPEVKASISPLLIRLTDFRTINEPYLSLLQNIHGGNLIQNSEQNTSQYQDGNLASGMRLGSAASHNRSQIERSQSPSDLESHSIREPGFGHSRSLNQNLGRDGVQGAGQPRQKRQASGRGKQHQELLQINEEQKAMINKQELSRLKMFKSNSAEDFKEQMLNGGNSINDSRMIIGNQSLMEDLDNPIVENAPKTTELEISSKAPSSAQNRPASGKRQKKKSQQKGNVGASKTTKDSIKSTQRYGRRTPDDLKLQGVDTDGLLDESKLKSNSPINGVDILDRLPADIIMNINSSIETNNNRGQKRNTKQSQGASVPSTGANTSMNTSHRPQSAHSKKKKGSAGNPNSAGQNAVVSANPVPNSSSVLSEQERQLLLASKQIKMKASRMSQGTKPMKNYQSATNASHNNSRLVDAVEDEGNRIKGQTIEGSTGFQITNKLNQDTSPTNDRSMKLNNGNLIQGARAKGQVSSQKYSPNDKMFFSNNIQKQIAGQNQLFKYETTNNSAARIITLTTQNNNVQGAFVKKKSKDKNQYDLNLEQLRKQIMISDQRKQIATSHGQSSAGHQSNLKQHKQKQKQPQRSGTPGLPNSSVLQGGAASSYLQNYAQMAKQIGNPQYSQNNIAYKKQQSANISLQQEKRIREQLKPLNKNNMSVIEQYNNRLISNAQNDISKSSLNERKKSAQQSQQQMMFPSYNKPHTPVRKKYGSDQVKENLGGGSSQNRDNQKLNQLAIQKHSQSPFARRSGASEEPEGIDLGGESISIHQEERKGRGGNRSQGKTPKGFGDGL